MSHEVKPITIKRPSNNNVPVMLQKIILKKDMLQGNKNIKLVKALSVQEDVLCDSKAGGFLPGDLREFVLINRLNKFTNSCRTVALCKSLTGKSFEKTSDEVTKIIGQSKYDTLFSALCSVINQDLKIRGIYSLLTIPNSTKQAVSQTEDFKMNGACVKNDIKYVETQSQTDESYLNMFKGKIKRRTKRKQVAPYVIRDDTDMKKLKRIVISPDDFGTILKNTSNMPDDESQKSVSTWPDLGGTLFNEDSNNSVGKFSMISASTSSELMNDPLGIISNVDKLTRNETDQYRIHDLDAAKNTSANNNKLTPSQEMLKNLPPNIRMKMLMQQALNDYNNCLNWDESGHLPIHAAILNNDIGLLKRQCVVFKMRDISVDIQADNLTPLKMSLYQENVQMTTLLLQHNADILDSDIDDKTYFHIAAELNTEHLQALVNHCQHNARQILEVYEELWKKEYENKTDTELAQILLNHINNLYDNQGYTPLMLASKLGRYENVKLLLDNSSNIVNIKTTSSGDTALYLAVRAACMDSVERGNKSKVVDHFRKTIEILVENGADPSVSNFAGSNVNDLLTECNIGDLSMLIANKMTCRNLYDGKIPEGVKKFDSFILVKDETGKVNFSPMEDGRKRPRTKQVHNPNITKKTTTILQNVPYTPPTVTPSARIPHAVIVRNETITGQKYTTLPVTPDLIKNNMSKVQSFQLNKPLILKSVATQNKRKIEITVEPNSKKTNTND